MEMKTNMSDEIIYRFCLRCGRKLKSDEAKRLGYGKKCFIKSKQVKSDRKLF